GPTGAVDCGGCGLVRQAAVEPGGARDVVRLFARLGHTAADDLFDIGRVDPSMVEQTHLHLAQELRRMEPGEIAEPFSVERSDSIDDDGGHEVLRFCSVLDPPSKLESILRDVKIRAGGSRNLDSPRLGALA